MDDIASIQVKGDPAVNRIRKGFSDALSSVFEVVGIRDGFAQVAIFWGVVVPALVGFLVWKYWK